MHSDELLPCGKRYGGDETSHNTEKSFESQLTSGLPGDCPHVLHNLENVRLHEQRTARPEVLLYARHKLRLYFHMKKKQRETQMPMPRKRTNDARRRRRTCEAAEAGVHPLLRLRILPG